jgi:hypothetical protein
MRTASPPLNSSVKHLWQRERRMVSTEHDLELEAYRQASDDLRHYSSLRFTVLGAFVAISGGLFTLSVERIEDSHAFSAITMFNIVVAFVFAVFEWRINAIAEFYAKKIDILAEQLKMSQAACDAPSQSALGRWLAPLLMFLIYGGSVGMWLYTCFV